MENKPKEVYKAIVAVQGEMAEIGISKDSTNQQQGFKFRGIDAVYNALAPLLAKHKLCIIPRCQSRIQTERESRQGGALFSVVLDVEYDVVSAIDGSCHIARLPGEAMDSADKATNKGMSAAYKYLCIQMFCIPTEGESPDADGQSHDPKPRGSQPPEHRGPDGEMLVVSKVKEIIPTANPKFVTVHTVDGKKLGTGDEHLIEVANTVMKSGEEVRFHYIMNGRFTDLTGIDRREPAPGAHAGAAAEPEPGKHDPHKMGAMAPSAGHKMAVGLITEQLPTNAQGYTGWLMDNMQNEDGSDMKFASKDPMIVSRIAESIKNKTRVRMEYSPATKKGLANIVFNVRPVPMDEIPF